MANQSPPSPTVPSSIYQPLLRMAQQGYDANDIKLWYLTVCRHLKRIGVENASVAYSMSPPLRTHLPTAASIETPSRLLSEEDISSLRASTILPQDGPSPKTEINAWTNNYSFDPFGDTQLQLGSASEQTLQNFEQPNDNRLVPPVPALPVQDHMEPRNDNNPNVRLSAHWSPTAAAAAEIDVNELSSAATAATEAVAYGTNRLGTNPWYSPEDFRTINNAQATRASLYSTPYQMSMSTTAVPLLVPYDQQRPHQNPPVPTFDPPPTQPYGHSRSYSVGQSIAPPSGMSFSSSFDNPHSFLYSPTISVIPSRKRRKLLQRGVKKIIQPLQAQRQASV